MFALPFRWLTPATLCVLAVAAAAQTAPTGLRKANPMDASATVPAVVYESSFRPDRRRADGTVIPWRDSNDTVGRIGGWRAYAREAQQPESLPPGPSALSAPSAPSTSPTPAEQAAKPGSQALPNAHGHAGHKTP